MARKQRKQREHRPHEIGPRVYRDGRWYRADLRPWNGPRVSLRNPKDPRWPRSGERTEDEDTARKWSWAYVEYYRAGARHRAEGKTRSRRLDEAFDVWKAHRSQTVEPNTRGTDRTAMAHMLDHFGGSVKTEDITTEKMQGFVNDRLEKGYKVTTLQTLLTSLSAFFKWNGGHNPISFYNPATNKTVAVKLPERQLSEVHAWSDGQVERLREAADYVVRSRWERNWPNPRKVLEFFLASGCRQQEGFAAIGRRMNRENRTIRIVEQLDRETTKVRQLKGKLARTVLLLPEWWEWDEEDDGLILGTPAGRHLGYRSQVNLLTRILDAARLKMPNVAYHSLRHTYARRFIELGGRFEELQKSLGHASIRTTEMDYGHFHDDVAAKLARMRIYKEGGVRVVK